MGCWSRDWTSGTPRFSFLRIDAVMSVRGFRGFWSVVAREDCLGHSLRYDRKAGCWSTWAWDSRSNSSSSKESPRSGSGTSRGLCWDLFSLFFLGPFLGAPSAQTGPRPRGWTLAGRTSDLSRSHYQNFSSPFSRFEHQLSHSGDNTKTWLR